MGHAAVAHVAAVDVDVLLVGTRARGIGQADAAVYADAAESVLQGAAVGDEVGAEHVAPALFGRGGAPLRDRLGVVPEREANVGPRQRMAAQRLEAVRGLGRVGLQELAPCRRAEEQLAHFDAAADRARRRAQLTAARVEPHRVRGVGAAAGQAQFRHRGDRGQCLAAKPHRRHAFQIEQRADLAGGMALERQRQLVRRDAAAVVLDHDAAHATGDQAHADLRGAGIERVVQQLAHHRGRALDHLAGRDLADQLVGQLEDGAARRGAEHGVHRHIVGSACAGFDAGAGAAFDPLTAGGRHAASPAAPRRRGGGACPPRLS